MTSATPEHGFGAQEIIIGVDEAGRGPLAGPVVAGAAVLCDNPPSGLADSKKLTAKRRAVLDLEIRASCIWAVGKVDPAEIDRINILQATMLAMTIAVQRVLVLLDRAPTAILIDGNLTPEGRCHQWRSPAGSAVRAIVGGDGSEPCISAASIVAKEWRDRAMVAAAQEYPHYGWERNKGYGTRQHLAALHEYGASPHHRQSFAPVAQLHLI
ncbi:ribonuclease HII [Pontixanthobacter sp.]|uniref:ribonuclease HII n=1 Tax=Pontixanthobacter sp. TaxID=2792078 RepID=UPI003C7BAF27